MAKAAVMSKWLAGHNAALTARVRAPHECRFSMQFFNAVQGHCTAAFYDAITGPTEFIISVVNSLKMVNIPLAWLPLLDGRKESWHIIIIVIIIIIIIKRCRNVRLGESDLCPNEADDPSNTIPTYRKKEEIRKK